jgi:hypothetical protein
MPNIAAVKPIIATFKPVLMLLPGHFRTGTLLLQMAMRLQPKGKITNILYSSQFVEVNAESRIVV